MNCYEVGRILDVILRKEPVVRMFHLDPVRRVSPHPSKSSIDDIVDIKTHPEVSQVQFEVKVLDRRPDLLEDVPLSVVLSLELRQHLHLLLVNLYPISPMPGDIHLIELPAVLIVVFYCPLSRLEEVLARVSEVGLNVLPPHRFC